MPLVSVVVPVYNVEDYLSQSILSVCRQTFDDIEIICVNDGSTDASGDILGALARIDERIVVITKQNGGVSSAKNTGIAAARGEYICFFDPDDLLDEDTCSIVVREFLRTGADVLTYGGVAYPAHREYRWLADALSPQRGDYDEGTPKLLFDSASVPFAWRTAVRRSFLTETGVLYDEGLPYGEDIAFQFALYTRSKRTSLIPDKLVKYRVSRPGSFMDSRLSDQRRMAADHIRIADHILRDWRETGFSFRYPEDAMDWVAHFAILRIMRLDECYRSELLDEFSATVGPYFDRETWLAYASKGKACEMVKAAFFDRSLAFGNRRRFATYRYLVRVDGVGEVMSALLDGFAYGVKERLGLNKRALAFDEDWECSDAKIRCKATESVMRAAEEGRLFAVGERRR